MSTNLAIRELARAPGCPFNRNWWTWLPIVLADVSAVTLACVASVFLRLAWNAQFKAGDYSPFILAIPLCLITFSQAGLYPGIALNPVQELRRAVSSVTAVFLMLLSATFLMKVSGDYSRLIFLMAWSLSIVLVVTFRSVLRGILARQTWWGVPVVVLGAGATAQRVVRTLQKHSSLGLKVIAMLDDGVNEEELRGAPVPVLGGLEMAPVVAYNFGVRYAVIAMPMARTQELTDAIRRYGHSFDRILIIPDFFDMSSLWASAKDLGGMLGLELTQTLTQAGPQVFKRAVDLMIALLGGILILPLIGVIYFAIRMTTTMAVLYDHERIGKDGRRFRVWKFRTMVGNAAKVLEEYLEDNVEAKREWELNQKLRNDPRVTRIGRILRKTSLDELPQIWNIIRGDMSLVGPRPIVQSEIHRYGHDFDLYRQVRPGITGLWQVSGRNQTTYEERVQYDGYYVRNWSVWLDLYILARTIQTVLAGEGAY